MKQNVTPRQCPDPHQVPALPDDGQESRTPVAATLPDDPILAEMRWVAIEARALMSAETDPERIVRFEDRKRALLNSINRW